MYITIESDAQVMQSLNSVPGYNLPTAVEAESPLIVAHEGCADANDQRQIQPMAQAASDVLLAPCTADAGYANAAQITALQAQGIRCYVPAKRTINNQTGGRRSGLPPWSTDR